MMVLIPSVFKFYHIIHESIFIQSADNFIKNEISINPEIEVLTKELNYQDENPEIILNIGGKYINEEQINNWKLQLTNYEMGNVNLEIHNLQSKAIDEEELLNKILVDNDKKILSISEERDLYKSELQNIMREKNALDELNTCLKLVEGSIKQMANASRKNNSPSKKRKASAFRKRKVSTHNSSTRKPCKSNQVRDRSTGRCRKRKSPSKKI